MTNIEDGFLKDLVLWINVHKSKNLHDKGSLTSAWRGGTFLTFFDTTPTDKWFNDYAGDYNTEGALAHVLATDLGVDGFRQVVQFCKKHAKKHWCLAYCQEAFDQHDSVCKNAKPPVPNTKTHFDFCYLIDPDVGMEAGKIHDDAKVCADGNDMLYLFDEHTGKKNEHLWKVEAGDEESDDVSSDDEDANN